LYPVLRLQISLFFRNKQENQEKGIRRRETGVGKKQKDFVGAAFVTVLLNASSAKGAGYL